MRTSNVPLPTVPGVRHRHVEVGELVVHVAEAGSGPPLVLIHGWPQHWYCWRSLVPLLADDFTLIMPDLRGHGWSSAPKSGYDKEQLATDLLALLDVLDLDRVGLVGHDWGGWVGFLSCLRAPERFSAFVALGILHPFQRLSAAKVVQVWRGAYQVLLSAPVVARAVLQASPRAVAGVVRAGTTNQAAFSDADLRAYADVLRDGDHARASVQLYRTFLLHEAALLARRYGHQRLEVRTHLLIGAHDPIYSPALLAGWEANADDMEVDVVDGVGHFLPEEAPGIVAATIRRVVDHTW